MLFGPKMSLHAVWSSYLKILFKGNQRPVKTETNRRTATDEFTLSNVKYEVKHDWTVILVPYSHNTNFRITFLSSEIFWTEKYLSLKDSFGMIPTGSLVEFGLNRGLIQNKLDSVAISHLGWPSWTGIVVLSIKHVILSYGHKVTFCQYLTSVIIWEENS